VPGIEAALDGLAARGIRTCVASSGTHAKMTMTLGLTGLLPRFEGRIYSGTQVARGKPAPDLFVFAARQMGCPVGECVVVEDSVAGVAAAMAARMRVIAFGSGVTPRNRLERPGVLVIDDMAELPTVVVTLDNATAG
jgi:HAD superfamily hydrolase (TIGR01509 family)